MFTIKLMVIFQEKYLTQLLLNKKHIRFDDSENSNYMDIRMTYILNSNFHI